MWIWGLVSIRASASVSATPVLVACEWWLPLWGFVIMALWRCCILLRLSTTALWIWKTAGSIAWCVLVPLKMRSCVCYVHVRFTVFGGDCNVHWFSRVKSRDEGGGEDGRQFLKTLEKSELQGNVSWHYATGITSGFSHSKPNKVLCLDRL